MIRLAVYFDPPEHYITYLGNLSDKIQIIVCTNRDDLKNCLPETEILITLLSWPDAEMIRLSSKLQWIQALTAGVDFFPLSDYVINLLPGTPETKGLIDKEFFSLMRRSACFINLGRGSTVNQTDLIDALQTKTIRALVSDVYETEPLPGDSPLWHLDNVILTPHIAGISPQYLDRALDIIRHNLQVYINQSGEMMNVVDLTKGY